MAVRCSRRGNGEGVRRQLQAFLYGTRLQAVRAASAALCTERHPAEVVHRA